jgi:hypothetical protein
MLFLVEAGFEAELFELIYKVSKVEISSVRSSPLTYAAIRSLESSYILL